MYPWSLHGACQLPWWWLHWETIGRDPPRVQVGYNNSEPSLPISTSGGCARETLAAAIGPGPLVTKSGAGWRQGRLQWSQGENLATSLDQRFAHTNVNLESAWSMPDILVVQVVTPACSMLPRPSMSAGGVNNSDTIRCDSVFQKIIRRLIIWLCCTVAVF